jgi:hypothetical protein
MDSISYIYTYEIESIFFNNAVYLVDILYRLRKSIIQPIL